MAAAAVREATGIPGTSTQTAFLCRDKPAMKEVLRNAGIACAQSTRAETPQDARDFAAAVGYPADHQATGRRRRLRHLQGRDDDSLEQVIGESGLADGHAVAVEEFIEGHEGYIDTLTINGEVGHEFITHYYPNVLEAMRERWISPQMVTTNRIDAPGYAEVREMTRNVIRMLDIGTSATHMEWFYGPKGLKFSEIGCRPPGVGQWDVYNAANEFDLYFEWANAHCARQHAQPAVAPLRRRHDRAAPGSRWPHQRLIRALMRSASATGTASWPRNCRMPARPRSRSRPATWPMRGCACVTPTTTSCARSSMTLARR